MTREIIQSRDAQADAARAGRRAALAKLGLGAAAVYLAPTVTRLDSARAAFPSNCAGGGGGGQPPSNGGGSGGGGGCQ